MDKITSNAELAAAVNAAIAESGIKKTWISDKLGIHRQGLDQLLSKKNFSIADANKILDVIGKEISVEINDKKK